MSSHNMQQQVERARQEVNVLKATLASSAASGGGASAAAVDRTIHKKVQQSEQLLAQAEAAIRRVKAAGNGAQRPPPAPREADRARRALAVLRSARIAMAPPASAGGGASAPENALRTEQLPELYKRTSQEAKLGIGPLRPDGCGFLCEHVFRAYMWFRPVDPRACAEGGAAAGAIEPEWIALFGIDEPSVGRWSASRHAVFGVLTERANAAVRYFWAREKSGADAFVALARWLATHRTMFTDTCDGRRLAFDASRGFFLPACVRSFDGLGGARFTRGSIPLRNSSAYTRNAAAASGAAAAAAAAQQPPAAAAQAGATAPAQPAPQATPQGNGATVKMET